MRDLLRVRLERPALPPLLTRPFTPPALVPALLRSRPGNLDIQRRVSEGIESVGIGRRGRTEPSRAPTPPPPGRRRSGASEPGPAAGGQEERAAPAPATHAEEGAKAGAAAAAAQASPEGASPKAGEEHATRGGHAVVGPADAETARHLGAGHERPAPEPAPAPTAAHEPGEPVHRGVVVHPAAAHKPRRPDPVLTPLAASHSARLGVSAILAISQVLNDGARRRASLRQLFVHRMALLGDVVGTVVGVVSLVHAYAVGILLGRVMTRALMLRTRATKIFTHVTGVGARAGAAITAEVAVGVGRIGGAVGGTLGSIGSLAGKVVIPDVPGAARARALVTGTLGRIRAAVTAVTNGVLGFAARLAAQVVATVLGLVQRVGSAILAMANLVLGRIIALIGRLVVSITAAVRRIIGLVLRAAAVVRRLMMRAYRVLDRVLVSAQHAAIARIAAAMTAGLAAIARVQDAAAPDPPPAGGRGAVRGPRQKVRDAVAAAAMAMVVLRARVAFHLALGLFRMRTANLLSLVVGYFLSVAAKFAVTVLWAGLEVVARIRAAVAEAVRKVFAMVQQVVSQVVSLVAGIIAQTRAVVPKVVRHVRGLVTTVLDYLTALARRVIGALRDLVVAGIKASTGGLFPSIDLSVATRPGAAFSPQVLQSQAVVAFAAPAVLPALPAFLEGLAALGAFIAGLEPAVALWWLALILLVILLIVAIVLYYRQRSHKEIEGKVREREKGRAPDKKRDPEKKLDPRRLRDPDKLPDDPPRPPPTDPVPDEHGEARPPFYWDPRTRVQKAALQGAVDARQRAVRMHYEGHHCWPEYLGGSPDQPLMGVRVTVHHVIHGRGPRCLHDHVAPVARSYGFILVRDTAANQPWIAKMRTTKQARDDFSKAMLVYYGVVLNTVTDPPVPAPAYAPGIAHSYARMAGP